MANKAKTTIEGGARPPAGEQGGVGGFEPEQQPPSAGRVQLIQRFLLHIAEAGDHQTGPAAADFRHDGHQVLQGIGALSALKNKRPESITDNGLAGGLNGLFDAQPIPDQIPATRVNAAVGTAAPAVIG